jgi:catechol 1,2-dioxygenase
MKNLSGKPLPRRRFIKQATICAVAVTLPRLSACSEEVPGVDGRCKTTADILGPFYKADAPFHEDIIPGGNTSVPLIVEGKVFSHCDKALQNAVVEIWNADEAGAYDMSAAFRFRGRYKTPAGGAYRFKTIIPGRYLNGNAFRPSHIHFRITAPGHETLVSQIYFKDDPFIADDPWAGSPGASERILPFTKDANGMDSVTFNIYLHPL